MNKSFILLSLLCLLSSCATTFKGYLTDADTHFSVPVKSESHDYAVFTSLRANHPAGIVYQTDKFLYLDIEPSLLSKYATEELKIKGKKVTESIVFPDKIWLQEAGKWVLIYPNK